MTLITKRKRGKPEQSQIVTFLKLVLKLIQSISSLALVTHPIVCTLRQLATFKPFYHQFCSTSYRAGNVQVKCVVSSSNQPLRSLPINAGVHDDLFLCGKVQFRNRARSHLPSPLHHIWSKLLFYPREGMKSSWNMVNSLSSDSSIRTLHFEDLSSFVT
jgi:hypothetical protein